MSADFDITPTPGQLTDTTNPSPSPGWSAIRAHGYDWISLQCFNGMSTVAAVQDLSGVRAGGFPNVGVWGVVYNVADFHAFGVGFAREAVRLGADHAMVDAEMCAKSTKPGGMKPIIDGMREGGWHGPVHLTTYGAPSNAIPHGGNDFGMDIESYLDSGGGLFPQVYYNAYDEYRPDLCADYWEACGCPRHLQNHMIYPHPEGGSAKYPTDFTGAEWAGYLQDAGVGRNFSIFMTQFMDDNDYAGLDAQTALPAPTPPKPAEPEKPPAEEEAEMEPVTSQESRVTVEFAARAWEQQHEEYQAKSRLVVCRRIAQEANVDGKWNPIRDEIVKLLDDAGLPK